MSFAADYNAEGAPGSLTPRGVFVPPWYKPHTAEQLALEVKDRHGKSLGFTIGDVAVERRWAISPEGQVLAPNDFEKWLHEWYIGQWAWQNPPQRGTMIDTSAFPAPETYVSKGPNPTDPTRLVCITPPVSRPKDGPAERPVDTQQLAKSGWKSAPKKE